MKSKSLVAMLLAATLVVSACGAPAAPATGTEAAPSGGSGKQVSLRMVESLTSPERTAVLRGIADKYEAQNPNVKIEIISPPLEGADQKIAQMLMNKQPMDVVEVREQTATQFVNNGWIAPMDKYVEAWEEYDTLTQAAKDSITLIGGKAYLIPYGFYQRALFYRQDWFKEAGLEVPKTWEDIYESGKKLVDPAKNRFGWSFRGAKGGFFYADMFYWDYLGFDKIAHPTGGYFTKDGKTIFSTPEAKEALEFYKKIFTDISPKDSIAWGFSEMVQGFMGGTTAMLVQDPEVVASCAASMKEGEWGVAKMPVGPSGQSMFPNGYAGWGITSFTENPDIAADFVLFLSNAENNTDFARQYSTIPIHSTAPDMDSYFKEGPFATYMEMAKEPDVYKFVSAPQQYAAFAEYFATIDQMYQKYLTDAITADDLLKYLDEYWSKALADEGQLW